MSTVRTNDVETYYERRGDGPPIVFVHGAAVDHSQWDAQVAALEPDHTAVVYDVRGHGLTGGSDRERYSIDLFADDLRALVAALDLDRPVICGHSMGGCIAQTYAAVHPEGLSGLVLADTFTPEMFGRAEWIQRSLALRAAILPARLVGYERVERVMVWLHERLSRGASGDYGAIERLRAGGPPMTTDEFAKVIRAVASFHETTVDLGSITVPTLVLYGEREPTFVRRHAARLGSAIPDATVHEVPGAGHAANLDDPAFFTAELRAFIAGLGGTDPPDADDG